MNTADPAVANSERRRAALVALALAGATLVAYHNSLSVPFLFDDKGSITDNTTIRHLWPLGPVLSPPHSDGETVGGRPLLNLTLALNYAWGGLRVTSYHVVNLLIHFAAGLTLFGVIRRTLQLTSRRAQLEDDQSVFIAFVAALVWTIHPLQTESVTYVVQRAESLVSLWYLLVLYTWIRSAERDLAADAATARRWRIAAVAACLAGMMTKEVMVTAPVLVLLHDRAFVAGSFRAAWRARWRFFLCLAATWLVLWWLVVGTGGRGGTAGWSVQTMTVADYLLTQGFAVIRYLWLTFWPEALVFDYGFDPLTNPAVVWPSAVLLLALLAGSVLALWRQPRLGFAAAAFFLVLAPSSSVVPIASEAIAEHRAYFAIAAVIGLAIWLAFRASGRRAIAGVLVAAVALGMLTIRRNHDYRSAFALWTDTAAKWPNNPRVHNNLAAILNDAGRFEAAAAEAQAALRLDPRFAEAHSNFAMARGAQGDRTAAITHLREALRLKPNYPEALNNLGRELMADRAQLPDAIACFQRALQARPNYAEARTNLGLALTNAGRPTEALPHLVAAVELQPQSYQAHNNLGIALASCGRAAEALVEFARAAELNPTLPNIQENWAKALRLLGRNDEAAAHFQRAAELRARR